MSLAVLSGALLALSFPPFDLGFLIWPALAPLLYAAGRSLSARSAAEFGAVTGLVFYGISLHWIVYIFGPMGLALLCIPALFLSFFCFLAWKTKERVKSAFLICLLWAVFWTGGEYFRSECWKLEFSWLALGYSQTPFLSVLQSTSLIGVYGLSFLIVFVNGALALALEKRLAPLAASGLLAAACFFWGNSRLGRALETAQTRTVALIQSESFDPDKMARMTLEAAEKTPPDLVVWPEVSVVYPPGQREKAIQDLRRRLAGVRAVFLIGMMDLEGRENLAVAFSPRKGVLGSYFKAHPVPFMESRVVAGKKFEPISTEKGVLGPQICYDLDFENGTREMVRRGAQVILVPNLDAQSWGRWQHLQHSAMSSVRAVESGRWIARAASSGLSQIIDPKGRIVQSLGLDEEGVLTGTVGLETGHTFYVRWGWIFPRLCLVLTLLAGLWIFLL